MYEKNGMATAIPFFLCLRSSLLLAEGVAFGAGATVGRRTTATDLNFIQVTAVVCLIVVDTIADVATNAGAILFLIHGVLPPCFWSRASIARKAKKDTPKD